MIYIRRHDESVLLINFLAHEFTHRILQSSVRFVFIFFPNCRSFYILDFAYASLALALELVRYEVYTRCVHIYSIKMY